MNSWCIAHEFSCTSVSTDSTYWMDPNGGSVSDAVKVTCRQINDEWSTCIQPELKDNWKVRASTAPLNLLQSDIYFSFLPCSLFCTTAALQVSALVFGHAQPRSISVSQQLSKYSNRTYWSQRRSIPCHKIFRELTAQNYRRRGMSGKSRDYHMSLTWPPVTIHVSLSISLSSTPYTPKFHSRCQLWDGTRRNHCRWEKFVLPNCLPVQPDPLSTFWTLWLIKHL